MNNNGEILNCFQDLYRNKNKLISINESFNLNSKKYCDLLDNEKRLLEELGAKNIKIIRDNGKYICYNEITKEYILGDEKEICIYLSRKLGYKIKIVNCLLKTSKDKKYEDVNNIIFLSKEKIALKVGNIFFRNSQDRFIKNKDGNYFENTIKYTDLLTKRLNSKSAKIEEYKSLISKLLLNITSKKNASYIVYWLGKIFVNLKNMDTLILIGNKDVSKKLLLESIIKPIFGENCISITEDALKVFSEEELLNNYFFYHIDFIPSDAKDLEKLRNIIFAVLKRRYLSSSGNIEVVGQILITLNESNPFINDLVNFYSAFFVDSLENIMPNLGVESELMLHKRIADDLDLFVDELCHLGKEDVNLSVLENSNEELRKVTEDFKENEINTLKVLNSSNIDNVIYPFERFKHTHITGQSGSGKSEIVKTLLFRDIERNDCSVILLDPHGDLALEVTKKIKDKERLIFIDPSLDDEKTPTINLFELEDKSEKNIREVTKIILSVIKDINEDSPISVGMEDILNSCISVLLRKGNSDFRELYRFMNDNRNTDLLELGKKSPNDLEKEFFEDYFGDNNKNTTKESIRKRLKTLLNDEIFSNLMNGKSTINLEKEMNRKGKIIIFRIPKNRMLDTYKYYTRFVLGLIQIIALKRADLKESDRVHTHLFIDEFHNFITPSIEEILTESRKYKLFLTLAHQSVSQISSPKLRDIILSNTNVKIIGNNRNKTLEAMNKTLNEKLVDVENLEIGEFYIKAGNNPLIKVKNSDEYIGDKNSLSENEWNESKEYQLNHYYRDIKVINEVEEIDIKVDEFIAAVLSKNLVYFEKIKERDETLYEELIYNFNDENGFIAQPLLSKYFAIINDNNHFSENKVFLQKLKEKNKFFNQDLDKNKTYKSKKRYLLQ